MKNSVFIACLLLLAGCRESSLNESVSIVESDLRKEIHISDDVNLFCRCVRMFEDSTGQYLTIERESNSKTPDELVFYSLSDGRESYRVPVYKDGPNAIYGGLFGHSFLTRDTIVLTSKYTPDLYFINKNGELIKHYNIRIDGSCVSMIQCTLINAAVEFDQKGLAYISQEPPYGQTFDFNDCCLALSVDTATGEVKKSKLSFPFLYEMNSKRTIAHNDDYSLVKIGTDFVYAFTCLDSIMVTQDYKTAKMYNAKSQYAGVIPNEGLPRGTAHFEQMKRNLDPTYGNIIYDKYRDVIYRFYHFDDYGYKGNYGVDYLLSKGEFSIIVLNSDYEIIGETRFPRGKYAPRLFYVDKEGLWLSENNYERIGVDMSDSLMVFRCLKLDYAK